MSLSDRLKARALTLGFALAGITTPDPPPHVEVYEHWLAAGLHGPMAYLAAERARQRRADPREVLPGCQSIVVLATHYAPLPLSDGGLPSGRRPGGGVAAYALGRDYHEVLLPRMAALVAWLEADVGHPVTHKLYTDTGPILERDLAQRAGLGWIGKNTCLISPRLGSYLLLSEMLLDLPLDPDPPFLPDRCGACTRCLEACPTGCIRPDRTLDAGRCISTLTIELKGAIPHELRSQIGNWLFGCDVCQMVCPWNRFAEKEEGRRKEEGGRRKKEEGRRKEEEGRRKEEGGKEEGGKEEGGRLMAEMTLTPEQFRRKYRGSAVRRAQRRGYLRNIAVALGNSGDRAAIPALAAALSDGEPLVRAHAAWALGQIGGEGAKAALREAVGVEADPHVAREMLRALEALLRGESRPRFPE
ncbi:MAG: tRNA epoxyqueuosine(34) reductase QueG [Chloroflexi bacterium]|nr:tRNA epoxyqueuosine(34) reductase QueG [Chloroflexota bacterium]